jgi:transcriptional regulator with XRE-family HTH domain
MRLERIKNLREDHDYTQAKLSKMLNISQRTYSYYETGGRSVPIEIVCDLASIYQTSIDYILGVTDNKNAYERKKNNKKEK